VSGASEALGRRIAAAKDLGAVVRSMKALAASCIGQYEQAVAALDAYCRTVEMGLAVCLREQREQLETPAPRGARPFGALVVGSDQGLVGRFNEELFDFARRQLQATGRPISPLWSVGERMQRLAAGSPLNAGQTFAVPGSVDAITLAVNEILLALERAREAGLIGEIRVFHNRPTAGAGYDPIGERLLPLDAVWQSRLIAVAWPASRLPEAIGDAGAALEHFTREYLFVVLFRACAESLASENATRLAAMQRAEKSIDDMRQTLNRRYQRLRQGAIDEELFDVVSGYELLRDADG
jgi:F-type H+-transporting ATPase subunit gamma